MLSLVGRALKVKTHQSQTTFDKYQVVDDFLAGIGDKNEREFAAYLTPRLLGESSE